MSVHLIAPPEFYTFTPEQLDDICNGCGSKGSRLPVPNTIWGLSIVRACNAHDLCYHLRKDKARSDAAFLANMHILIEAAFKESSRWARWTGVALVLRELRRLRAWTYYRAVADLGGPAYERAA